MILIYYQMNLAVEFIQLTNDDNENSKASKLLFIVQRDKFYFTNGNDFEKYPHISLLTSDYILITAPFWHVQDFEKWN